MKYNTLEIGEEIHFTRLTDMYGVAEFEFCIVYEGKGIKEIYISPRQQPDKKEGWVITIDNNPEFMQSFIIEGEDYMQNQFRRINVWYCETHKCNCFNVCVPQGYNVLVCDHVGSDVFFKFKRG